MKHLLIPLFFILWVPVARSQSSLPDSGALMGYFQEQRYDLAMAYLDTLVGAHPENRRYLSLMGYACFMDGQLTQASGCYQQLLKTDPGDLNACNFLGKIRLREGDRTGALQFFCRLVEAKPGVSEYNRQLAALWDNMGNGSAAAWYYERAYRVNPGNPEVVAGLASHLIDQKRYPRADSILDAGLLGDSLQASLLELRIRSVYEQKRYPLIFPLVARLERMGNVTLHPFLYTALAYYYTRQYPSCVATCDLLISKGFTTRTVLYLEAMAFKEQKKYTLCLAMLDECIASALSKDADDYLSAKGDVYELRHQNRQAIREYDTAYYLFRNPLQLYNKARLYDIPLKSPETALRYYRRYLAKRRDSVAPDEKKAWEFARERSRQLQHWERQKAQK